MALNGVTNTSRNVVHRLTTYPPIFSMLSKEMVKEGSFYSKSDSPFITFFGSFYSHLKPQLKSKSCSAELVINKRAVKFKVWKFYLLFLFNLFVVGFFRRQLLVQRRNAHLKILPMWSAEKLLFIFRKSSFRCFNSLIFQQTTFHREAKTQLHRQR